MSKRFDVVIGNPPYQEAAHGAGTRDTPIYHRFMDAAYELGTKVVLITPARFLFNAGLTPKAWNERMLNDPHLSVPYYLPSSGELFPGTDIKGGIAVTYRDADNVGVPIETFTKFSQLNDILRKVHEHHSLSIGEVGITSSRSYRYTERLYQDHPHALALRPEGNTALVSTNAFDQFDFLYHKEKPADGHDYVQMLGLSKNRRLRRWIRRDYVTGPHSFTAYKVAISKANGTGTFGEALASPHVISPNVAVTQSFITIGSFSTQVEAEACLTYVKTKFARTLLGVLKITQDNSAKVWNYVPLEDFTASSDIDWSKLIPEIDQQLYAKYGLDDDEIAFIEDHVKPMD